MIARRGELERRQRNARPLLSVIETVTRSRFSSYDGRRPGGLVQGCEIDRVCAGLGPNAEGETWWWFASPRGVIRSGSGSFGSIAERRTRTQ